MRGRSCTSRSSRRRRTPVSTMRQSRTRRSTADDARLRGGAQRVARGAKRALHPVVGVVGRPVAATLERALRNSARRGGIALLYHSVDSVRGNPTRELVPAHDTRLFEAQIRYVRERYRIVRAEQLVDAAAARRPGERFPVAITFDDDLACHTSFVAPALLDRQATATFFLALPRGAVHLLVAAPPTCARRGCPGQARRRPRHRAAQRLDSRVGEGDHENEPCSA